MKLFCGIRKIGEVLRLAVLDREGRPCCAARSRPERRGGTPSSAYWESSEKHTEPDWWSRQQPPVTGRHISRRSPGGACGVAQDSLRILARTPLAKEDLYAEADPYRNPWSWQRSGDGRMRRDFPVRLEDRLPGLPRHLEAERYAHRWDGLAGEIRRFSPEGKKP